MNWVTTSSMTNHKEVYMQTQTKQAVGSNLKRMIHRYTEITVDEHMRGYMNLESDKTWKKIAMLIDELTGWGEE